MQLLKAFVGHSFSADDEAIVLKFLKYLTSVAENNGRFTWAHAEKPQAQSVHEKVLHYFDGKNLFIGICTRYEQVVEATNNIQWYRKLAGVWKQPRNDWKTSDWIIQEIGVAIGRQLPIIFLLEDGVRRPGQLQGNLEYIPFTRQSPEQCFGKLLDMLSSLTPSQNESEPVGLLTSNVQEESQIESAPDNSSNIEPNGSWNSGDWDYALMRAIATGNQTLESSLTTAFSKFLGENSQEKIDEWEARRESLKIVFDKQGSLDRLLGFAAKNPANSTIARQLAETYEHFEEYARAGEILFDAQRSALDIDERVAMLGRAAISFLKAGKEAESLDASEHIHSINISDVKTERLALHYERTLAELRKDGQREVAAIERMLELNPSDSESRFSLAYRYSQIEGTNSASLLHYLRIPAGERSGMAWNNLGWAYESSKVPVLAIECYRNAEEKKESLGASNLARKYLESGFKSEAKNTLDAATKFPEYNKIIDRSLANLKEISDEETKREEIVLLEARPIIEYNRYFGRALTKSMPSSINGIWNAKNCQLNIVFENNSLTAVGKYKSPMGIGASLFLGQVAENRDNLPSTVVRYEGRTSGKTFVGTLTLHIEGEKQKPSALLSSTPKPTVLMWLSDDNNAFHVFERSATPSYYKITRRV